MNAQLSPQQPGSFFCLETQVKPERQVGLATVQRVSSHTSRHQRDYCPNCCSQEPTRLEGGEVLCRNCGWTIARAEAPRPMSGPEWFARMRQVVAQATEWRRA